MLSKVLNKAIFWQKHSQVNISERQQIVLNIYLDGYIGKLTAKNWAKHSDVSHDTAVRDIKDLVDKEILLSLMHFEGTKEMNCKEVFIAFFCD